MGHYVSIAQCAVCAWLLFWSIFYNILLWSIFLKTPLAALKNILFGSPFLLEKVPIGSLFHSKMGPHFYKFRNPLHVGAVDDALDDIGLFQSVCGQFKLIKVVFGRKLQFLKTIVVFFFNNH